MGAASSLDSLIGTPCDTGTRQAGRLSVTYTPEQDGTDTVSVACNRTNPVYTLNVKVTERITALLAVCEGSPRSVCARGAAARS